MWLLPGRADHEHRRVARCESAADRRRHRQRAVREPVPVRDVSTNSACGPSCGCSVGREIMQRRTFLKLGAAAGGAFVVGCAFGPTGGAIWRHHRLTGEFQPNAWIRILPDNTIIFTLDRVEMGQGTTTSHAMLVAEELEV